MSENAAPARSCIFNGVVYGFSVFFGQVGGLLTQTITQQQLKT